nr:E3 ubiquitin ligase BIG BROTHER [Ipomoea trifida]
MTGLSEGHPSLLLTVGNGAHVPDLLPASSAAAFVSSGASWRSGLPRHPSPFGEQSRALPWFRRRPAEQAVVVTSAATPLRGNNRIGSSTVVASSEAEQPASTFSVLRGGTGRRQRFLLLCFPDELMVAGSIGEASWRGWLLLRHLPRLDEDCGELISRKTLARLEDKDDSSDDVDEELEGVVEIASSNFETSTAHMEARHTALRACHKGKATAAEKGKGWTADATPSDPTLAACLPSTSVETTYWSMNMNWYKFGFSGMENSYYTPYECSSHLSTMDLTEQQPWNYPAMMNVEEPVAVETVETVESTSEENTAPSVDANPEHNFDDFCLFFISISNAEVPEQQDGANDQGFRGSTCRPPDMLATCTSCIVSVGDFSNRYTWEIIPDRPTYGEIVEEQ